jgi:nucleotide-binding universal stress UspA family protein
MASSNGTQVHKVVLAVDNSESTLNKVVAFAAQHYKYPEYHIDVVHVLPAYEPIPLGSAAAAAFSTETNEAEADKRKEDAKTFLKTKVIPALQKALPNKKFEAMVIQAEGDSSKKIGQRVIKYAVDHEAAMLVMASHSKKPLIEFWLGSVTSYCAHHSLVPVVILH